MQFLKNLVKINKKQKWIYEKKRLQNDGENDIMFYIRVLWLTVILKDDTEQITK